MRDVLGELSQWWSEGRRAALATVIHTWGSAPRGVGAKMAVSDDGRIAGSVSGGCVEAAVVQTSGAVLKSNAPQMMEFGVADETAWGVGLACGGRLEVYIEPADRLPAGLTEAILDESAVALVTLLDGYPEKLWIGVDGRGGGSLGERTDPARAAASEALAKGRSASVTLGGKRAFVDVILPAPTLVVVGGVHIAMALTELARGIGFRTVVIDPRAAFGNRDRFPHADRLLTSWPDEAIEQLGLTPSTAVAVLTHDPKLDDPALKAALRSAAFYVGALGSQATQAKRRTRLLDAGLSEEELARLHGPIGLDLGGRSPEEIALSVLAQIVSVRNGRTR